MCAFWCVRASRFRRSKPSRETCAIPIPCCARWPASKACTISRGWSAAIPLGGVRDAARARGAALTRGNVGERHLLGAANWEFSEFFARLGRIAHRAPPLFRMPSPLKVAAAHWMERWARDQGREPDLPASDVEMGECWFFIDSSKSQRLLGFEPRDPVETLTDTVRYVRRHFLAKGA